MADTTGTERCQMGCRITAGAVGVLGLILMAALWGWSFFLSLVIAAVIGAALWYGLPRLVCDEEAAAAPSAAAPPPQRATSGPRSAAGTGPAEGETVAGGEEPSRRMGASEAEAPAQPASAPSGPPESPAAPPPATGAATGAEPETGPTAEPAPAAATGVAEAGPEPQTAAPVSTAMEEVPEGAEEKPGTLSGPRAGGADDLKRIRGIGPKLEQTLHGLGVYHYDQIADWSPREAAWVDRHLEGFRGRVTRDDWVAQARALLQG